MSGTRKTYLKGDILLGAFPFSSGTDGKVRPVLVLLDSGDDDVLVARMTTKPAVSSFDVQISEWRQAGLNNPAVVRLHKLHTALKDQIQKPIGHLAPADHQRVSAILGGMFGNW